MSKFKPTAVAMSVAAALSTLGAPYALAESVEYEVDTVESAMSAQARRTRAIPARRVVRQPVANTALVAERNASPGYTQIGLASAYSAGLTGAGVTVAVLDTGLNLSNPEFANNSRVLTGFNTFDNSTNVGDGHGHGTHVAGIIGASRNAVGMHGVAYEANLLPVKVMNDGGSGSGMTLDQGVRYAVGRASIVSMSLGATGAIGESTFKAGVSGGLLLVAAAGNRSAAYSDYPARWAKETWANGQIIVVGAVDSSNNMAGWSNRAGDAAPWYLVAPGVGIYSTYGTGYGNMSGTSMATPVVAGAAALIKQGWPYLTASQVANVLLVTATDLGAPGIDEVYGRGLLNVDRAMQPIGDLSTVTWNGRSVPVLGASMVTSSATAFAASAAASGKLKISGVDEAGRDFAVDLSSAVSKAPGLSLSSVFGATDSRVEVAERVMSGGARLSIVTDTQSSMTQMQTPRFDGIQPSKVAAFSLTAKTSRGIEASVGSGLVGQYFGLGGLKLNATPNLAQVNALANPYLSLVQGAGYGALGLTKGSTTVRLGVVGSVPGNPLNAQWGAIDGTSSGTGAVLEMTRDFGAYALGATVTTTTEDHARLGARSAGALSLGGKSATTALQVNAALRLAPQVALAGQMAWGQTSGFSGSDSVFSSGTRARTHAFGVALVGSDRLMTGDRVSVSVSQPMRAYSGSVTMDSLAYLDDQGAAVRESRQLSMSPDGREILTELNYRMPVDKDATVGLTLVNRTNPMHMTSIGSERMVALRFDRRF